LFGKLTGKDKKGDPKEESHEERWKKGKAAVQAYLKTQSQHEEVFVEDYDAGLAGLKAQYGFTTLKMSEDGGSVDAAMSPGEPIKNDWPLVARRKLTAPAGLTIQKGVSKSGNQRVFAITKDGVKKFVYNARTKKWQHIKDDERIRKAEEAMRAQLRSERASYISLVEAAKSASAQGFDAGGMGRKAGEKDERVIIGEVKGGFRKGEQYFAADKFTAITSSLTTNLDQSRRVAEKKKVVDRFDEAVASGNITVVIQLVGKAVVASTVWPKLEALIRKKLRAYIKANYDDVELDDVMKNVRIQWR
jgi:hypothetical protein